MPIHSAPLYAYQVCTRTCIPGAPQHRAPALRLQLGAAAGSTRGLLTARGQRVGGQRLSKGQGVDLPNAVAAPRQRWDRAPYNYRAPRRPYVPYLFYVHKPRVQMSSAGK